MNCERCPGWQAHSSRLITNKSEYMEQNYVAPAVEIIEVEVEQGFAVSTDYIGVGNGTKPSAAPGSRGDWDDIW